MNLFDVMIKRYNKLVMEYTFLFSKINLNIKTEKFKKFLYSNNHLTMSIKETLFVFGVVFKNTFILRNFYELIPLTYHNNYTYSKGDKISYLGIESSFVSIIPKLGTKGKMEPPIRGIRNTSTDGSSSSAFGNSVAHDFQIMMKNFHIKVSSSKSGDCKFHITGITLWSQVDTVVSGFISQLKCIESLWIPFFQLPFDQRLMFVKEIYNIVVSGQQLRYFEDPYVINWIESLSGDKEILKPCAKLFVRYVMEDKTPELFGQRLSRICSLETGKYSIFHQDVDFNFVRYDIYNGSYAGHIGYNELYFIHLVRKLTEQGYLVGFSNLGRDEIRILIEIQTNMSNINGGKNEEKKQHLFTVKKSGSVTLSSKGMPNEALAMGKHVIQAIRLIVESPEYNAEKIGKQYDSMYAMRNCNNITNIQPQIQMQASSMIPMNNQSSFLDNLIDEYGNNLEI